MMGMEHIASPRAIRLQLLSHDTLLVEPAERVVPVLSKRRNTLKASALVQCDSSVLVNAGFQSQESHASVSGIDGKMIQQQLAKTQTPKLRTNVHPLQFAVVCAK